jgi:phosphatidylinositol alpha-mannosyltransferase
MRVAIVCPYDLGRDGGVQDQAIRLQGWLDRLGHESVLVGPGTDGPTGAELLGTVRVVKANRSATPISFDPRVGRRLKEIFENVDVAHIHEPLMPSVGIAATRVGSVPKVGTFHADPPAWVRRSYKGARLLVRQLVSKLDISTATSSVSLSAVSPFIDPRVVPNGIDTELYGGQTKAPLTVSFLGRDDPRKGLSVLLEAWPSVTEVVPGATLTVIGAERETDRDDIRFLGRVSEDEKRFELARSEIYCAPNLGGESFGIVVAEAMASGCAPVVSAIPAFAHVTAGGGELVAPGDAEGLARRIVALLTDDARRTAVQARAIERAGDFDGAVVAEAYVAAYQAAIASK